jgi:glycerophosphoryl diester phosphodiesterase
MPARVYAHRGASAYAPENTLAAYAEAARMRADFVEIDVRRSRDGELVVAHDATLARCTDVAAVFPDRADAAVGDFTLAELRRLDAGSWFHPPFLGERIPVLAEVLDVVAEFDLGLLLEVKSPDLYPGLDEQIAASLHARPDVMRAGRERLIVQSFDADFVRSFRSVAPRIAVGVLGHPDDLAALASFSDYVNPNHDGLAADYVDAVHAAGMSVITWTVDEPPDIERVLGLGVDGVISNKPDLVRR